MKTLGKISAEKMVIKSEGDETILLRCDRDCSDTIQIQDGVTIIGPWAFKDCEKITKVVIPSTVKEIDAGAFYDCKNLKTVIVSLDMTDTSKGLRRIGTEAFYGCTSLCNLSIPQSVDTIENSAFEECEHLHNVVISNNEPTIESGVFARCKLDKVPDWIKRVNGIKSCLFEGNSMSMVIIPKNVEFIDEYAFSSNPIDTIVINATSIDVGKFAFAYCSPKKIRLKSKNPIWNIKDWFSGDDVNEKVLNNCVLYVPKGTKDKYLELDVYNEFADIIEDQ